MTALRRTSVGRRWSSSRSVRLRSPPGIARMAVVHLVVELLARDGDLLGVHDDDEVARVDVRRVLGLALAAEHVRDLRSETPERLALCVDEVPAALDLARLCVPGLHLVTEKRRTTVRRGRIVAARAENPRRRHGWDGGRTGRRVPPLRRGRRRSRGGRRASSRRNGADSSISARVGRRFVRGRAGTCGCVGTTFQQSVSSSSSSSASTRRTIVALASAGPRPVSCRSEVNGTPETRAPR